MPLELEDARRVPATEGCAMLEMWLDATFELEGSRRLAPSTLALDLKRTVSFRFHPDRVYEISFPHFLTGRHPENPGVTGVPVLYMNGSTDAHDRLEVVCRAIGLLLKELAQGRCSGAISEASFVEIVLKIESEQVTPGGFTLTASNTIDNWTVFKVRMNANNETCAAFEFLPETGEFRRVGG